MDKDLKRSIILDNYQNPRHFGDTNDSSYIKVNMNSTSCIDEVNVLIKLNDNNIVEDIMKTAPWITILSVNKLTIIAINAPTANQNTRKPRLMISIMRKIPERINQNFHIKIPPFSFENYKNTK